MLICQKLLRSDPRSVSRRDAIVASAFQPEARSAGFRAGVAGTRRGTLVSSRQLESACVQLRRDTSGPPGTHSAWKAEATDKPLARYFLALFMRAPYSDASSQLLNPGENLFAPA